LEISQEAPEALGGSAVPTAPGAEMNLMPTDLVFEPCSTHVPADEPARYVTSLNVAGMAGPV
jgi:hypothetical protein